MRSAVGIAYLFCDNSRFHTTPVAAEVWNLGLTWKVSTPNKFTIRGLFSVYRGMHLTVDGFLQQHLTLNAAMNSTVDV